MAPSYVATTSTAPGDRALQAIVPRRRFLRTSALQEGPDGTTCCCRRSRTCAPVGPDSVALLMAVPPEDASAGKTMGGTERHKSGRRGSVSASVLAAVISRHVPDVCAHRARARAPAPQDTALIMKQTVNDTETPELAF
ncbi:unnamed protein product [Rangifer tarandus platyrhynchus]|uniref:Uncharacterized protein n=1 Tax=Rangifer tarandus platyrhynchus TaxID=3082113 RepID=A0ACB1KD98_RANTA|nr:unnamed protein product [Rangifer tarandus platyrhynchus]